MDVTPDRDQRRFATSIRLGVAQGRGDARERLHVLHERGSAPKPHGGGQRRLGPGPGLAALQRLEYRRLLAGDIAVLAPADLDRQAVQRSRGDRARERFRGPVERALQEDDRFARPDRPGGEHEAGDHVVRPPQHDEPVLVGAGLALGAVGDHEGQAALDAHRPPLAGRLEPAPAPATQTGGGEPLDEGFRGQRVEGVRRQGGQAPERGVIISACRAGLPRGLTRGSGRPALRAGRAILHKIVQMV